MKAIFHLLLRLLFRYRASFPGEGEMIAGTLHLAQPGTRPFDRALTSACVWVAGALAAWFAWRAMRGCMPSHIQPRT